MTMLEKNPPKGKRQSRYKKVEEEAVSKLVSLHPLNDTQRDYINALNTSDQIIVCGYSGTGKTYIAATHAANMYLSRKIDKIIITRPIVSVGKDLGYFKGDLNEKFTPWAAPVLDVLEQQLGKGVLETGMKNDNIILSPLSTMRGRSFQNSFVLLDEAQNTTLAEMKMFLTRIGKGTKVVVNGDIRQSDIKEASGLSKIIHMAKKYKMDVPVIEFGIDDIVRSDICRDWIISFEKEGI